jgi:type III restriction enzyme
MILKNYQTEAITKLLSRSNELISSGSNKKLIFQAPTGSGKTIIMAQLLTEFVTNPDFDTHSFSFIWAAPRKLHHQSREKLTNYYIQTHALVCREFIELNDNKIEENEILFLNWESINKLENNTIILENEREFYLEKVIENTLEEGRKIILIIDESHHHATSEISKQLIAVMSPNLTIEVSATPTLENPDEIVKVALDSVRAEGMIKKYTSLNEGFKNILNKNSIESELSKGQDEFVLKQAMSKREELVNLYRNEGIAVNPLLLIQLPDKKATEDEILRQEIVKSLRDNYDITVDNGKLAIYLSEEKENLENIAKNSNETEVLIFKQAIALGWDCPRAQILVLFREHKSVAFSIQTIGRILRMPEPEIGHYQVEELNRAYVYTNISDISINEELARGYITINTSKRLDSYEPINLKSVYRLRQRERTRLNSEFLQLFLKSAEEYSLKTKLKLENQVVSQGLISDQVINNIDELGNTTISSEHEILIKNEIDLQKIFDSFIRRNLEPFHPEERSVGRLKESIYAFFVVSFDLEYSIDQFRIVNITLSSDNY